MKRFVCVATLVITLSFMLAKTSLVQAITFSLDAPTAPLSGVFPDDLLAAGAGPPPPVPPPLHLPGAAGIVGPPPVDVDAFSFTQLFRAGHSVIGAEFSVAPGSLGVAASALAAESALGDQPADIFGSGLVGGNTLLWDGDGVASPGLGSIGPVGVFEPPTVPPGGPASSNVDGWDAGPLFGPVVSPGIVFSITAADALGHPVYSGSGETGGSLFFSPPVPGYSVAPALYASFAAIGLVTLDDIDAVEVIDGGVVGPSPGDTIYFSLTPGSPTLAGLGASPADILVTAIGGAPAVAFPAASLGMIGTTDDMDALYLVTIPEPLTASLLWSASLVFLRWRRC